MATSGTTAFNLDLSDILEEAYELCGLKMSSGYDYRTARRGLDLLFLEWQNKGLNLFSVETGTQTLTEGTISYDLSSNVLEVIEAFIKKKPILNIYPGIQKYSRKALTKELDRYLKKI